MFLHIVVQSLDDDSDLPELEAGGAANKSDVKIENDSAERMDTPTVAATTTAENILLPSMTEQSSTNSVDDNKDSSDAVL